jgi:hypothetical protein
LPFTVLKKIVAQRRGPPGSVRSFYAVHRSMSLAGAARVLGLPGEKLAREVWSGGAEPTQEDRIERANRLA